VDVDGHTEVHGEIVPEFSECVGDSDDGQPQHGCASFRSREWGLET
jgi:hypothetical protein